MIDQDRLETARAVLVAMAAKDTFAGSGLDVVERSIRYANELHDGLEATQRHDTGHAAETALEQLIALLAEHPDDKLPKWIRANAKHRKLAELNTYLGADIETP